MTFEATVSHAVASGALELFQLPDWESRLPVRRLWVAPELWDWIDGNDEYHLPRSILGGRTIFEQIEGMLIAMRCADRPPGASELKRMTPTKDGIWKLHPPGSRLYGWAPQPESFVVVSGATEEETKQGRIPGKLSINDQHLNKVKAFIKMHGFGDYVIRGDYRAIFPRQA